MHMKYLCRLVAFGFSIVFTVINYGKRSKAGKYY